MQIIFFPHAQSTDQTLGIASGHSQTPLSEKGYDNAKKLKTAWNNHPFDAIFSSDLPRALQTAQAIFSQHTTKIISDARLREVDYGFFTGKERSVIRQEKTQRINIPFPEGESYEDVIKRYTAFLISCLKKDFNEIAIVGHGCYPLEVLCNNRKLEETLNDKPIPEPKKYILESKSLLSQ